MDKKATGIEAEHDEQRTQELSSEPYGPPGFRGISASKYVAIQGVISVILVMDSFLDRFTEVSDGAPGAGFYKGLMTAMITLGAFLGMWLDGPKHFKKTIHYDCCRYLHPRISVADSICKLCHACCCSPYWWHRLSMVVPLYISEISPPEIRGTLLVLEELSIVIGIVISFWITYGTQYIKSHWSWQLPFLIQIVPGLLLGFGAILLPYSPRWLASKGREEDALVNLAKLRQLPQTDARVQREWIEIIAEAKFQQTILEERHPKLMKGGAIEKLKLEFAAWSDCLKPGCWRRTHIGAGLMFFQQVSVLTRNASNVYLFGTMGLDHNMQLIMSGVLNVTQLIGVASSLWTLDRFGRRKLLMWGSVFMTISHVVIAALVGQFSSDWPSHRGQGWTSVGFLLLYMLAFGASWGPVPWAMPAEVFPSSLRAKGVSISTCMPDWLNNFIVGLITPPMVQNTGFGAYIFFAVFCFLSLLWTYFFVPETTGKTLEQMDEVFNDFRSAEEADRKAALFNEVVNTRFTREA